MSALEDRLRTGTHGDYCASVLKHDGRCDCGLEQARAELADIRERLERAAWDMGQVRMICAVHLPNGRVRDEALARIDAYLAALRAGATKETG